MANSQKWIISEALTKRACIYPPQFPHHRAILAFLYHTNAHIEPFCRSGLPFVIWNLGSNYASEIMWPAATTNSQALRNGDSEYIFRQKHPCDLVRSDLSLASCQELLPHKMRVYWSLSLLAALSGFKGAYAGLVDEIVDAIANAVDCDSCHALLVPLKKVAMMSDSDFSDTLLAVCKTIGNDDDDVCEGNVSRHAPALAHDLRSISVDGDTATKICQIVFGLCLAEVIQFKLPLPAAPANPKQWKSRGRKPLQVAHFTDVHVDRQYTPGSEANCTKPICCRNFPDDAGKPVQVPAGPLGSHKCDTSTGLVQSMLREISARDTAFSIFTGDVIEGDSWEVTRSNNTRELEQFNQEMQTLLDAPVFPAIGNHEPAPVNLLPRNTTSGGLGSVQWVFDTQSAGWSKWLGASAASEVKHMSGSYSVVAPGTSLRIISMNTLYWYGPNLWLYDSDTFQPDPNGLLAFLAQQLQAAEGAGQRAWIIAHVSPSSFDALHDQSNYFDQIVQRYKNTIAGQFYGHTHLDEFAISYSDYTNRTAENAVSTMWIAPSLTPRKGNAAFKVYEVDPDTYEIMDAKSLISDLADPSFQINPQWKQFYSSREVYGSAIGGWPAHTPLSPAFWHKVTEAFEQDDTLFQKFLEFKSGGFDIETCAPGACKDAAICALRGGRAQDACRIPSPGFNLRRRGGEDPAEGKRADHCEGAHLGTIFSQLSEKTTMIDIEELKRKLKEMVPKNVADI